MIGRLVSRVTGGVLLLALAWLLPGCNRAKEPPPPPTVQEVKEGLDKTAERIRNDPKLSPEEKERMLRVLYGVGAGIPTRETGDKR